MKNRIKKPLLIVERSCIARPLALFATLWLITFSALAQGNGADPAVISVDLVPAPLANVGSTFSIYFTIGNTGAGEIMGDSDAERMGFYVDLKKCIPNPANVSAVSGSILNSFDVTYDPILNRFNGRQKLGVKLPFATVRRFIASVVVTQASNFTAINDIGATCTIIPNSNSLGLNGYVGQPIEDDFAKIFTHTMYTTGAPLPVSLISFTAQAEKNQTVLVKWTTSWEKSNKGFIVERSKDLKSFETVGRIPEVAGTNSSTKAYQFVDQHPTRGTSYYRLKQVDLDGSTYTYKAVSVKVDG
ncbi:hypothetical protein [Spirosoma sp.]|uniref:hypothetical protein n=1 Tax=Spirosoma sp. TaxID=1899569 RepID=UPI003B3AC073